MGVMINRSFFHVIVEICVMLESVDIRFHRHLGFIRRRDNQKTRTYSNHAFFWPVLL